MTLGKCYCNMTISSQLELWLLPLRSRGNADMCWLRTENSRIKRQTVIRTYKLLMKSCQVCWMAALPVKKDRHTEARHCDCVKKNKWRWHFHIFQLGIDLHAKHGTVTSSFVKAIHNLHNEVIMRKTNEVVATSYLLLWYLRTVLTRFRHYDNIQTELIYQLNTQCWDALQCTGLDSRLVQVEFVQLLSSAIKCTSTAMETWRWDWQRETSDLHKLSPAPSSTYSVHHRYHCLLGHVWTPHQCVEWQLTINCTICITDDCRTNVFSLVPEKAADAISEVLNSKISLCFVCKIGY